MESKHHRAPCTVFMTCASLVLLPYVGILPAQYRGETGVKSNGILTLNRHEFS